MKFRGNLKAIINIESWRKYRPVFYLKEEKSKTSVMFARFAIYSQDLRGFFVRKFPKLKVKTPKKGLGV